MNLVSDVASEAPKRDKRLVNPWGIAAGPTGPFWIANNETGVLTAYNRAGVPVRDGNTKYTVAIPLGPDQRGQGRPTGAVYNGTNGFVLVGDFSAPATYLIVTENGMITGWNDDVTGDAAVVMLDNSATGAQYTGVTLITGKSGPQLAVANFAQGTVDIYDSNLQLVISARDDSVDEGFSPFNVANVDGMLLVSYAKRSAEGDEEAGPGLGFVDVFTPDGLFVRRFAEHGTLNAPWAIVRAPGDFGEFSGALLVGNFGDGRINAFNPLTGELLGQLEDRRGEPIEIEGLWGLAFGNGDIAGRTNWLYFTAGIDDEAHGLFGRISAQSQGV
jgi:uncharacterized protein (TIGR03118 family)